ncbi:MAG: aminotransferase class IV family protein [Candidatus Parabeggiatoa sp.]|nr:aminotransferase class IV family protein [Candidatus Parabeggiatoa sp.]
MHQLLETVKIINGKAPYVAFHNERLNQARRLLFGAEDKIDLTIFLQPPSQPGLYRARIIYAKTIETIEYLPYQDRRFQHFKIVEDNEIDYTFKYLNRDHLNRLLALKGQADDILIIKKGFVTDTSIANVAFWHQDKWLTPSTPLLKGTTRERLLSEKKIIEAEIRLEDLKNFSKMAIMNAMLGFYVIQKTPENGFESNIFI